LFFHLFTDVHGGELIVQTGSGAYGGAPPVLRFYFSGKWLGEMRHSPVLQRIVMDSPGILPSNIIIHPTQRKVSARMPLLLRAGDDGR
jgi:hypothetical protein